jgi:subtilisin family serine protease
MKRFILSITAIAMVVLVSVTATGSAALAPPLLPQKEYRIIIGYSGDDAVAEQIVKGLGFKILRKLDVFDAIVVTVPAFSEQHAVTKAKQLFASKAAKYGIKVRYVTIDRLVHATGFSDSPDVQWNIHMINMPLVWDTYYPYVGAYALGYGVQVAVLDTGIDYTHPELYGKVVWCVNIADPPWDYVGYNLRYCRDVNGHGTHVAGIIAAEIDGYGVAGVAPAVTLYAIKVLRNTGSGYISDIAYGIYYAVIGPDGILGTKDDADVLSMSLGGPVDDPLLHDATYWAYENGAIIVAAGNEGDGDPTTDEVSYPAKYPWVIAVATVDANGDSPTWSSEGPEVDVAAPGVDILSTLPRGDYGYMSGTSMATPHVSATVALIQAMRIAAGKPMLTFEQVYEALTATAIDLGPEGFDNFTGYGLIDAYAAVNYALQMP